MLNIFDYHTNPQQLKGYGSESHKLYNDINDLVHKMMHNPSRSQGLTFDDIIGSDPRHKQKILKIIASSPHSSYFYALTTLLSPFRLGEKAIATNPQRSYEYSRDVIGGRFKMGEEIISNDPHWSYYYARDVIKGRFEMGEEAMMNDEYYRGAYTDSILDPNGLKVKGFNA